MSFPLPDPELLRIIALACGMSVTLLGAGITAFYMTRLVATTVSAPARGACTRCRCKSSPRRRRRASTLPPST